MRTWMKYLIIGWSIVSVGIIIVSFQIMKTDFIQEDYEINMIYKSPEKFVPKSAESIVDSALKGKKEKQADFPHEWEVVAESLFYEKDVFDTLSITKKEFTDRMKKAKGVTIESKNKVKDKSVYVFLPLYAFTVWAIPILVFSLLGSLFTKKRE